MLCTFYPTLSIPILFSTPPLYASDPQIIRKKLKRKKIDWQMQAVQKPVIQVAFYVQRVHLLDVGTIILPRISRSSHLDLLLSIGLILIAEQRSCQYPDHLEQVRRKVHESVECLKSINIILLRENSQRKKCLP